MGEITARLSDRVEELEAQAQELAREPFMLGSTQQVARILFEVLGLTRGRKGKTGYSTDTRVLRSIRGEHAIVAVLEEWREYAKLLNTYLGPLPELISPTDGRLHTTFNQAVAATGRLSTSNPNLQAIPVRSDLGRQIRSAFIAEEGMRLLSADYSQVELRILAHISGEPVLRESFERGEDIHRRTAAEVLGKGTSAGSASLFLLCALTAVAGTLAHSMIDYNLHFVGNVEGKDLLAGVVDIIVTDGFSGNIALKTIEGVIASYNELIEQQLNASPFRKRIAGKVVREALENAHTIMDYAEIGGAPLLGVNGAVVVCHGRSSRRAMCNAVGMSLSLARLGVVSEIAAAMSARTANPPESLPLGSSASVS